MSGNGNVFEPTQQELDIYAYWQEQTNTKPRLPAVREGHLRRIRARLREGYSAADLKRVVDVACWDDFYVENGYHKQPIVIWKDSSRIERLLNLWERERERPIPL